MNPDSEYSHTLTVAQYLDLKKILWFHVPNEGKRTGFNGNNLKKIGLKPGVPDLFICVPRGTYHGLFIEMKTPKRRASTIAVSDHQLCWINNLNNSGYLAIVCFGADEALTEIDKYFSLPALNL